MSRQVFNPSDKLPEPYGIEDAIKSLYQVISVKHKPNYIQCCYQQEMYIYVRRWFSWYNSNLGPQMVHNPNGPVMVHFYVLSTNYTKKPSHSILKRRNKVNLIQMVHKWSTFIRHTNFHIQNDFNFYNRNQQGKVTINSL